MSLTLDVGIVNYNGGIHLSKCIASLQKLSKSKVNIFIFDNASSDNSFEEAKKQFPHCTFLTSGKNLGYAGGCNKLLSAMNADIVAFCNMDLEFDPKWGNAILSCYHNHPEAWSVASLVMEKESRNIYSSEVKLFWDLFAVSLQNPPPCYAPYNVISAYGAVMTFRRNVFDRIGNFDEDYFLFFEETEFYLRMNAAFLQTLLAPHAQVYHYRSLATVRFSPTKLYYSERNRIWTAFKYLPLWYFPFTFPLSIIRFALMSRKGVPKHDGSGSSLSVVKIFSVLVKAWISALLHLPREWKKRRKILKIMRSKSVILELIKNHLVPLRYLKVHSS